MKKNLFFILLSFSFSFLSAQTILLDPSGDGGFENGGTLAANGWTVADANAVTWFVGTAAGAQGGSNAAFVGSNSSTYTGSTAAVIKHFYRDIMIPSGATQVYLNYYLKMPTVDNTYDYFYIYTNTTAQTPTAGTLPAGTQRASYTTPLLGSFSARPQIDLTSLAGTTVRLVFTYVTDALSPYANPAVDNISLTCVLSGPTSPVFWNTSINSIPVFFDNIRAVSTPVFAVSSTGMAYNEMQIEINDKDDFTGTAYTQTFSGSYLSGTKYDFICNNLSPVLPSTDPAVYYVRARASADGGATWGTWSSQTWSFTHSASDYGWHQTAELQFNEGTFAGNFIQSTTNGTMADNILMTQGTFSESVIAGADDGVYENGTWYSTQTYATIGYQNDCNGPSNIYDAFRFSNVSIPRNANILNATMKLYASTDCFCEVLTSTISTQVAGHNHGAADAPALTSAIVSTTSNRTTSNAVWLQSTAWTNGTQYSTPDIANVVEELVAKPTWDAEDHMTLFIDSYNTGTYTTNRCISTYNYSTGTRAPSITGTYTDFENMITSPVVDFAAFVCSPSYSELKWTEDETYGSVKVQLYYDVAGVPTMIPDVALAGNSAGLTSPVDISGLNTTTYGKLYIVATLRYNSVNINESPILSDWSITSVPVASVNAGTDQSICNGASATLTATGCGVYTWSTGETTASITVSPSTTSTYTVTSTVGNGNSVFDDITITVNAGPSVTLQPAAQSLCEGGSATFTMTASGSGLTYQWQENTGSTWNNISDGGIYSGTTTPTLIIDPATAGMNGYQYQCIVSNTCPPAATSNPALLTVNPLPTAFNLTGGGAYCAGGTGSVIGLDGSESGVNYQLQLDGVDTGSPIGGTGSTISFGNQTSAGTYTVVTTNTSTTCSNNMANSVTVSINPLPTADAGTDEIICNGSSTTLSATGGITYFWNPASGLSDVNISNPLASPLSTTTYTVLVTDANGCTDTDDVLITVGSTITVNAGADDTICSGSSINLNATGGLNYSWDPSTGLSSVSIPDPIASPTITTTYTLTVTDAVGCSGTDEITITVNPLPVANAGADDAICAGDSAQIISSGGDIYSWAPTAGLDDASISSPLASPSSSTTYVLTVTNLYGCTDTDDILITVNPLPTANAGADETICLGTGVQLSAAGGTSFQWSPATGLSATNIANPVANPASTTLYTITVTNSNGCSDTDDILVTVNPLPTANAGNDASICSGDQTTLSASGGNAYEWSPATGLSATNISNPTANPASTTLYTVTATDGNGCSGTDQVTITVNPLPVVNAGPDVNICEGNSIQLSASGGTTYIWSPALGLSDTGIANPTANPISSTTYVVTATDINGCSSTDDVLVTVTAFPSVSLVSDPDQGYAYPGQLIIFTASPGGLNNYEFFVNNISVQNSSENIYSTSTMTENSSIMVIATDNGCPGEPDSLLIEVKPFPNAFTPFDANGKNDIFMKGLECTVFNRWGEILYQGSEGWDGKKDGKEVSPGTYYYILQLKDIGNNIIEVTGVITVVQK